MLQACAFSGSLSSQGSRVSAGCRCRESWQHRPAAVPVFCATADSQGAFVLGGHLLILISCAIMGVFRICKIMLQGTKRPIILQLRPVMKFDSDDRSCTLSLFFTVLIINYDWVIGKKLLQIVK